MQLKLRCVEKNSSMKWKTRVEIVAVQRLGAVLI